MFALRQCYASVLTEAADYYGRCDVTVRQWPGSAGISRAVKLRQLSVSGLV